MDMLFRKKTISIMEELKLEVKEIVADAIGLEMDEFQNDTHIYKELGADSVVGFEILTKLQKKYHITIAPNEVMDLLSINKICELIVKKTQNN